MSMCDVVMTSHVLRRRGVASQRVESEASPTSSSMTLEPVGRCGVLGRLHAGGHWIRQRFQKNAPCLANKSPPPFARSGRECRAAPRSMTMLEGIEDSHSRRTRSRQRDGGVRATLHRSNVKCDHLANFKPSSAAVRVQMISPPLLAVLSHWFCEPRVNAPSPRTGL